AAPPAKLLTLQTTFDAVSTSGGKVGFTHVISFSQSLPDSGNKNLEGTEALALVSSVDGSQADKKHPTVITLTLSNMDPGDVFIIRYDVRLTCAPNPGNVTGNVQTQMTDLKVGTEDKGAGAQTVPLKNAGDVLKVPPTINSQTSTSSISLG